MSQEEEEIGTNPITQIDPRTAQMEYPWMIGVIGLWSRNLYISETTAAIRAFAHGQIGNFKIWTRLVDAENGLESVLRIDDVNDTVERISPLRMMARELEPYPLSLVVTHVMFRDGLGAYTVVTIDDVLCVNWPTLAALAEEERKAIVAGTTACTEAAPTTNDQLAADVAVSRSRIGVDSDPD